MKKEKKVLIFFIVGALGYLFIVWCPPPVFLSIAPQTSLQEKSIAENVLAFDFSIDKSVIYFVQNNARGSVDVCKYDLNTSEKHLLHSSLVSIRTYPSASNSLLYAHGLGVVDNKSFSVLLSVREGEAYLWQMFFDNEQLIEESAITGGGTMVIKRSFRENPDIEYYETGVWGFLFQTLLKVTTVSSEEGVKIIQMKKKEYGIDYSSTELSACRIYFDGKFMSVSGCQVSSSSYYVGANGKLYIINQEGTLLEIE